MPDVLERSQPVCANCAKPLRRRSAGVWVHDDDRRSMFCGDPNDQQDVRRAEPKDEIR